MQKIEEQDNKTKVQESSKKAKNITKQTKRP